MASQDKHEQVPQQSQEAAASTQSIGWIEAIKRRYQLTKEDIETYPYVWASYGVVYGGLSFWLAYRWRKLRQLEDRVRMKQEMMRQRRAREAEAAKAAGKGPSGSNSTARPAENVSNQPILQVRDSTKRAEKI